MCARRSANRLFLCSIALSGLTFLLFVRNKQLRGKQLSQSLREINAFHSCQPVVMSNLYFVAFLLSTRHVAFAEGAYAGLDCRSDMRDYARDLQLRVFFVFFFFPFIQETRWCLIYFVVSPLAFRPIDSESYGASVF